VGDDNFSTVPRSALIFSFRDEQCGEVSLSVFYFEISVVFCFVVICLDRDFMVMTGVMLLHMGGRGKVYLFILSILTGSVQLLRSQGTDFFSGTS
jgi:hypothetical protein